jgi:hypothetical protein
VQGAVVSTWWGLDAAAWTALGTVIGALAAIAAGIFAGLAWRAARKQVEILRRQQEPEVGVRVEFSPEVDSIHASLAHVVIMNLGGGTAFDVSVKWIDEFVGWNDDGHDRGPRPGECVIPIMLPGERRSFRWHSLSVLKPLLLVGYSQHETSRVTSEGVRRIRGTLRWSKSAGAASSECEERPVIIDLSGATVPYCSDTRPASEQLVAMIRTLNFKVEPLTHAVRELAKQSK